LSATPGHHSDSEPDLPAPAGRPLRADAQRNRDRLVAVARAAFAAADDTVVLETIAREAGVGIGTLYRHFPTREALVEAVYAAELDDLTAGAATLLDEFPPDVALRAWMDRYATFVATKRGMIDTLRAGWAAGRIATPATRERITGTLETLLAAGVRAGSFRGDVTPDDLTALVLGVFLSTASDHVSEQTRRLLDLVVDALRHPVPATSATAGRSSARPCTSTTS
jgi:AcrR family transcriptional regulator